MAQAAAPGSPDRSQPQPYGAYGLLDVRPAPLAELHLTRDWGYRWPQHVDDLLEDMGLPIMRSGGNALTWPFKTIDLDEIKNLKIERDERRAKLIARAS